MNQEDLHLAYTLQSHFQSECLGLIEQFNFHSLPWCIVVLIGEFMQMNFQQVRNELNKFKSAWKYLQNKTYLSPGVLLRLQSILTGSEIPRQLDFFNRKVTLLCGNTVFPPREDMLRDVRRALRKYKASRDICKLVFNLLCVWHVFQDGNGRIARLLLSWHFGKLLHFKNNITKAEHWREGMVSIKVFRKMVLDTVHAHASNLVVNTLKKKYNNHTTCPFPLELVPLSQQCPDTTVAFDTYTTTTTNSTVFRRVFYTNKYRSKVWCCLSIFN